MYSVNLNIFVIVVEQGGHVAKQCIGRRTEALALRCSVLKLLNLIANSIRVCDL
jgi:hypothetical protein